MECKKCKWWVCGGESILEDKKPYDWGYCMKFAPKTFQRTKDISEPYHKYSTIVTDGYYTAYPRTNDTDFCGEFEPKDESEVNK